MTATIFDSHKYAKRLMDAGVPAQVADVQAEKIDAIEAKFDEKINTVTAQLDAKIADAKAELIRWMVSLSVLQLALISALLLKLTH